MLNHRYWFGERRNRSMYVFLFSIFLLVLLIPTVYAFLWSETIYVQPKVREFEFSTWQDGVYTVYLDNSFSGSLKTVEYMYSGWIDTQRPAYYVALAMVLILPPLIKYFSCYGWLKTIAISIGITAIVTFIVGFLLFQPII
jgi:hypothetical protein